MDKILSIQTIKNVFAALGAKTSDSNYGVALLDKTTAEPKGLMGMSDLASVLGVIRGQRITLDVGESKNFSGYGLWAIWGEPADGGAVLFTFQYNANSFTYIADPKNHHDNQWQLTKTTGLTFTITNMLDSSWTLNIVNLTA